MKLRKISTWFSVAVLVALGTNGLLMASIKQAHIRVVDAQEHRQQAAALTTELREETEQLASLVRAYAVTAEARYLTYYFDIIAIRTGEKAAPINFNPATYWDDVIAGRVTHQIPEHGERRSLEDRMRV